jgi:hypothetical protein
MPGGPRRPCAVEPPASTTLVVRRLACRAGGPRPDLAVVHAPAPAPTPWARCWGRRAVARPRRRARAAPGGRAGLARTRARRPGGRRAGRRSRPGGPARAHPRGAGVQPDGGEPVSSARASSRTVCGPLLRRRRGRGDAVAPSRRRGREAADEIRERGGETCWCSASRPRATRPPSASSRTALTLRSNVVASQVDLHAPYGGVVPEVAARAHLELMLPTVDQALVEAGVRTVRRRRDRRHLRARPGRRAAGRGVGGQGARAGPRPAAARGQPPAGPRRGRQLEYGLLEPPLLSLVVSGGHTSIVAMDETAASASSAPPSTTPPGRPSTRSPGSSGWATPVDPRSTGSPRAATPRPSRSPVRWPPRATTSRCRG